jgi:hypothetical protein
MRDARCDCRLQTCGAGTGADSRGGRWGPYVLYYHIVYTPAVRCPLSAVRCPLSAVRCPLSAARCAGGRGGGGGFGGAKGANANALRLTALISELIRSRPLCPLRNLVLSAQFGMAKIDLVFERPGWESSVCGLAFGV